MKIRFGTFPKEVQLFDSSGSLVETRFEEGIMIGFELSKKESQELFSGVDLNSLGIKSVLEALGKAKEE